MNPILSFTLKASIWAFSISALSAHSAQTCKDYIPDTTPNNRYTVDESKGTVLDAQTGLMWQQCSLGQTGASCSGTASQLNWQGALQAGPASSSGNFNDWRLPNQKELLSLVAYDCYNPSINQSIFPNTQTPRYWSSSPSANTSDYAWSVDFNKGYVNNRSRDISNYVRLVR
ncbi:MAG: DUF1566 domain-containing protein [Arenicellales bacterium]